LLYVASTQARDHLVVSLHRKAGSDVQTAANTLASAGPSAAPAATPFTGFIFDDS
jgi:ATP-dependent helicase/nuclease subunit A